MSIDLHWKDLSAEQKLDRLAMVIYCHMGQLDRLRDFTKIDHMPGYKEIKVRPTLEGYDHFLGVYPALRDRPPVDDKE